MHIGAMVTITGTPETVDELRTRLIGAMEKTRSEPGNLMAVLLENADDPLRFNLFEIFRDQEAIQAHRDAPSTKESTPIIHALFGEPMQVKYFDTINWPKDMTLSYPGA